MQMEQVKLQGGMSVPAQGIALGWDSDPHYQLVLPHSEETNLLNHCDISGGRE